MFNYYMLKLISMLKRFVRVLSYTADRK